MNLRLSEVLLEDVGLVRKAQFQLGKGLSVFTGETGSGKTMIIGGIGLGFGERAGADIVRSGADRARITLMFDLDDEAGGVFAEAGFPLDPGESAIVEREITAAGKSQARVNGRVATSAQVRELLTHFVERVGQHDQQRLLDAREHLELVDRFGGAPVLALRERVAQSHARLAELDRERIALQADRARNSADREEAEEALAQIDALAIGPGEDISARERRDRLLHAEKIASNVQKAHELLNENDDAAVSQLGRAVHALREIEQFDHHYADLVARLLAMQDDLSEAAHALSRELGEEDVQVHELEAIEARLEKIERMKRRYGGSIAGIDAARERYRAMLASETDHARLVADIGDRCRVAAEQLDANAERLTNARAKVAQRLAREVKAELAAVAMAAAQFEVRLVPLERIAATGAERIEFMLAPNASMRPRPISKVASGGELSRILLSLTVVLAGSNGTSLMIFDEIDAGIGGATASAVGERLYRLGRHVQVLCVTHLAQLAAYGDAHYTVEKSTKRSAQIEVRALRERDDVVVEVARMLSGSDTEIARRHALDLIERRHAAV